ncbi:MAG: hypothetical protein IKA17_05405 [Clostridia bacterium]|nr:hypothetical protein [Clostridia bacterium]
MAEKYGTIPPKFTKKWWNYFWEYYKIHTIVVLVIIVAVASTIYSKVNEPKYDLTICYAGASIFDEQTEENIRKEASKITPDVNENGESLCDFYQMSFSIEDKSGDVMMDEEYTRAMHTKMQLSLAGDEIYIYILDKSHLEFYATEKMDHCPFAPLKNWLEKDYKFSRYSVEGEDIAISLEGNQFLKKNGIDSTDKYLVMRYYPRKDQKKQLEGYKAAVKLANEILTFGE